MEQNTRDRRTEGLSGMFQVYHRSWTLLRPDPESCFSVAVKRGTLDPGSETALVLGVHVYPVHHLIYQT